MVRILNLLIPLFAVAPAFAVAVPTPEHASEASAVSEILETRDLMVGLMFAYQAQGCAAGDGGQDRFSIYKDHIYTMGSRQSFDINWQGSYNVNCNGKSQL
jgi:hypothetical protein